MEEWLLRLRIMENIFDVITPPPVCYPIKYNGNVFLNSMADPEKNSGIDTSDKIYSAFLQSWVVFV